ncbi:MAG TPA: TfuA-like protein, partial [Gemmatimonadaceae bacterium]|nr:TfuA-like protein [Gemmatimonadaceae bacterium]
SVDAGYREQSDAMVNIRATLAAAEAADVIGRETRLQVEQIAKGLFYAERIYPSILERAVRSAVPASELEALQIWLPAGRVNQKREDALAMLRRMRVHLRAGSGRKRVPWTFEHTDTWDEVTCQAGELQFASSPDAETLLLDCLLDELRLAGDPYFRARQGATARLLAIGEARRQGMILTSEKLQEVTDSFRRERRLLEPEDVTRWLTENHLTLEQFARLMEDEARQRWVEEMTKAEAAFLVPDHLRAEGDYPHWRGRALVKQRALEAGGGQNPALADVGLTEQMLLRWYFEERLGRHVPEDVAYYADSLGFPSEDAFRLALLREYSYSVDSQMPPMTR